MNDRPTPGHTPAWTCLRKQSRLQPTLCLPPALAGGPWAIPIKTSRLQPGFSECELISESASRRTWLKMVETSLDKPAEAGSVFGDGPCLPPAKAGGKRAVGQRPTERIRLPLTTGRKPTWATGSCLWAAPDPDSDDNTTVENAMGGVSIGWYSSIIGVVPGAGSSRDGANTACDSVAPIDEQSGPPAYNGKY